MKKKLAILTSHVIQYQTPLFKKLAQNERLEICVYFNWTFGSKPTYDVQFGRPISWDIPLLNGFGYEFLKNFSLKPSSNFWGQVNPGIIGELYKNRYDAVLIYGWNSFTNWLAFIFAPMFGTKIILHGESPLNQELLKSRSNLAFKRILLSWLFRRISYFLYIGEENKKFYEYYGVPPEKLFFAPYAVDNERLVGSFDDLKPARRKIRKEFGFADETVVILYVGKLMPKKRPVDLLLAYKKLNDGNKVLVFVGDGVLRPVLEQYVREKGIKNVRFAGFQNQSELPRFYTAADIFVLPSGAGETWGLVVNEAMCFGLPVVASDMVGCAPDLVKSGENGFVFKSGQPGDLAGYLGILMADRKKREIFGKRSSVIIKKYSHEKDIEGLFKALQ